MLIPLNFKNAKDIALSVVKTSDGYSVEPCNIVNGYGLDKLPSYMANSHKLKSEFNTIESVPMFKFEDSVGCSGPDLYDCIQKVLDKLEKKFN